MTGEDARLRRRAPKWIVVAGIAAAAIAAIAMIVLVVLVVTRPTGEGSPTPADARALADEACPRVATTHLYRVWRGSKSSFVLGTRHAGVPLAKYPAVVAAAFRASKKLVVESVLVGAGTWRPPQATASPTLALELGDELWSRYLTIVGPEIAARVERGSAPQAAAALALLYEDASRSVDVELQARARAERMPVVALEDEAATDHVAEAYLGIDQLRAFVAEIPDRAALRATTRRGLVAYCTGKRDARLLAHGSATTNRRTRAWIDRLAAELADGNAFVAIGQQHVEGDVNVLGLLVERGYQYEPVR